MILTNKRTPDDLRSRRGRVIIDERTVKNHPEDMLEVFAHFIVVRAEYLYMCGGIEYQGYCHLFDSLDDGCEPPTYDFVLTRNWRGQVTTIDVIKH